MVEGSVSECKVFLLLTMKHRKKFSKKVQLLINKAESDIPDAVIDTTHRFGDGRKGRKTNTFYKIIIVRSTTFRHKTMLYRNRNKLQNNA